MEKSLTYDPKNFSQKPSHGTDVRDTKVSTASDEDSSKEKEHSVNILKEIGDFQVFFTDVTEIPPQQYYAQISPQKNQSGIKQ